MDNKNWIRVVMRLLCGMIDYLLLLLPVQFVMLGIMQVKVSYADLLFQLLFAVYGVLMLEYNNGATVGKYLGRLMVVDRSGARVTMLYAGLRELMRSMYMIPVVGWIAGIVSVVMLFVKGQTLHDMAGNTKVIYRWQYKPPEE